MKFLEGCFPLGEGPGKIQEEINRKLYITFSTARVSKKPKLLASFPHFAIYLLGFFLFLHDGTYMPLNSRN